MIIEDLELDTHTSAQAKTDRHKKVFFLLFFKIMVDNGCDRVIGVVFKVCRSTIQESHTSEEENKET